MEKHEETGRISGKHRKTREIKTGENVEKHEKTGKLTEKNTGKS